MYEDSIIRIFCDVDDFCKAFERYIKGWLLQGKQTRTGFLTSSMSLSEIMTITILFHHSGFRCFKWYYMKYVQIHMKEYFPHQVSYNRFVELKSEILMPLALYTQKYRAGTVTGVSFIDTTPIKVCHCRRISSHEVFKGIAARGKNSTGWFYGFKLHLVINDMGEICSFYLSPGNVDDRNREVMERLSRDLWGKLYGDRGYISKELFELLYGRGIQLITKLKKNMKNVLMDIGDKLLLRKRGVIESVNDYLKNICQVEHTRHRSPLNFMVNLLAALSAYSFFPSKPSIWTGCKKEFALIHG